VKSLGVGCTAVQHRLGLMSGQSPMRLYPVLSCRVLGGLVPLLSLDRWGGLSPRGWAVPLVSNSSRQQGSAVVRVLRESEPKAYVCGEREIILKNWLSDGEADSPPSTGWPSGHSPRKSCGWSLKAICWQNSFFLQGSQSFVLLRPSTDWMRSTHTMKGSCFIHILISKLLHRNVQNTLTNM
jgi:hypothetical protein